ncbi:hypothetical protein MTR80_06200 [Alcaligenes aquatilis]|uniref:Uncharacterized protein n=1 Tax=Alcaligenes aquatilis TaxID=323284 RepID=A0ABY4NJS3_9BURK|nr:hypothetical protein [Alcaligenes aquatilis]UQN37293.1 hypothetical protein MTR80_06200 [Alcaligenes aquatilis]
MNKDLLMPAATIVAAYIARSGTDPYNQINLKEEFVRVYRQLEEAQKEISPPRSGGVLPTRGLT